MKWFVLVSFLACLAEFNEGFAIKNTKGQQDVFERSSKKEEEKASPVQISQEKVLGDNEDAQCLSGSEWESNCHYCRCSSSGVAECLKQDNCNIDEIIEPIRCKPNTTFGRDCNSCVCLENGLGLCTMNYCRRSSIPKKSDLISGKECAPGTRWKSQCNDCGCSSEGYALCTQKGCLEQESEPVLRCAPDSMWRNECNTCWCTSEGRALCTRIGCVSDFTNTALKEEAANFEGQQKQLKLKDNFKKNVLKLSSSHNNNLKLEETHGDVEDSTSLQENNEIDLLELKDPHIIMKRSVCKSNQSFKSDCNYCKCASDGQSYTCSHNECMDKDDGKEVEEDVEKEVEVFMESEGSDHIERHSVCKPRSTFYISCNTCHCNIDGTNYTCSNRPCALPEDVELFHELKVAISSRNITQAIVCQANHMFIKDCNTCWCNEDGTSYFCTRKVCVSDVTGVDEDKFEDFQIIKRDCRPEEVFELDCNTCRCNPDGESYSCTRRACIDKTAANGKNVSLARNIRSIPSQTPPKACQPRTEFRIDCNQCLCDPDGKEFSCTRYDCSKNNNGAARQKREVAREVETKCVPESVFDQECNVCRCTKDGNHAVCTLKRCQKAKNDTSENDVDSSDLETSFRCNPGEQFKRICNDCTCSADGRSVFCTLRLCEEDITPSENV